MLECNKTLHTLRWKYLANSCTCNNSTI